MDSITQASDTNLTEVRIEPTKSSVVSPISRQATSSLNNKLGDTGSNDPGDDHVSNPRVQYVLSVLDANGRRVEKDWMRPTKQSMQTMRESSDVAFVVKEIWNDNGPDNSGNDENDKDYNGKGKKIEIVLRGQELRNIMQDVLRKHLEHDQRTDWAAKVQTLEIPFCSEIRGLNDLSNACKSSQGSEQGRKDLQLLLNHLQYLRPDIVKLMESIEEVNKILPDDLYYLFRPGELVVSKPYLGEPQLFRISDCHWTTSKNETSVFEVVVWAFDWTGTELVQSYYSFQYKLEKKSSKEVKKLDIADLPCYPIRYYKNNEGASGEKVLKTLFDDLIARGQTFRNLCRKSSNGWQYTYNGELLCLPQKGTLTPEVFHFLRSTNGEKNIARKVEDSIMVDFEGYRRYGPNRSIIGSLGDLIPESTEPCKCKLCFDERSNCNQWMRDFANKDGENDTVHEKQNNLLLPARALGYRLRKKIWAQFHVRTIKDIKPPSSNEWSERLVFPEDLEGVKQDLKTLVEQHGRPVSDMVGDPVAEKGCGLVVLLHGPPGVGKTLTAETLALSLGKPLYVVGASDIGLDPGYAETALAPIFELTERWGAILLIDEADVFLDSRGSKGEGDVKKNALVSMMLRVLEYFKGILIMTTNRVMTFDVAILSRCHYAIDFKSLTRVQEKKIWQTYVDRLNEKNSEKKSDIKDWVEQVTKKRTKLNGREIRNVFTTAQTLAQAEPNKKIRRTHLERVYERLTEFLDAMEKTKTTAQAHLTAS